jgi:hypothetical protein
MDTSWSDNQLILWADERVYVYEFMAVRSKKICGETNGHVTLGTWSWKCESRVCLENDKTEDSYEYIS